MKQRTVGEKFVHCLDNRSGNNFFLIYLAGSALLFYFFNFNHTCFIWIFLILKPFMHGVSAFKINFFILYSSILCLVLLIPKAPKLPHSTSAIKKITFFSILLASLTGFWTFFSFIRKFGLPFDKYAYHFKEHYHTINYFAHIHTVKVPMFFLVKFLGLEHINEICDTAAPFAEYINPCLLIVLSLSSLVALCSFIALVRPVVMQWKRNQRFIVFIIYAYAGSHILKCLIDGGVFSYDLLVSLVAVHILFCSYSAQSLLHILKKNGLNYFLIIALFLSVITFFSLKGATLQALIGGTFYLSVFGLLFLVIIAKRVRPIKVILTAILCFTCIAFYLNVHTKRDIEALTYRIQEDDKVLYYDYSALNKGKPTFKVFDYSQEMRGRRVLDIYDVLGENPFRNRKVAIIKSNDPKYTGLIFMLKIMKSKNKINLPSNNFMTIHSVGSLTGLMGPRYRLQVSFNGNFFPALWMAKPSIVSQNNKYAILYYLNNYLTGHGITEYAVVPYYYWDTSAE